MSIYLYIMDVEVDVVIDGVVGVIEFFWRGV